MNVIVYLIESFMDPSDLHVKLTADPIPEFHAAAQTHASGYMIVPNEFCGSTSTEFELITGMSCSFLPKGACPYVQYVKRDMPTVPTFFRQHGYDTFTAHAGPPHLYDRVRVYKHFDVGETIWLTEITKEKLGCLGKNQGTCPTNVDISGRNPTDESLVDAVIEVSKTHPRYYMYASANTTHSPYDYDGYLASKLDVSDPMSQPAREELKTYINALHMSDRAIGKMLDYFQHSPQKTIIAIVGDHWPPFQNSKEIYAQSEGAAEWGPMALPTVRRVPLLIWSNFPSNDAHVVLSANFVTTEILSRIGIKPNGFLAINDELRSRLSVLSTNCIRTRDGKAITAESAGESLGHLMGDYRLLQYDVLLGDQYGLKNRCFARPPQS